MYFCLDCSHANIIVNEPRREKKIFSGGKKMLFRRRNRTQTLSGFRRIQVKTEPWKLMKTCQTNVKVVWSLTGLGRFIDHQFIDKRSDFMG